MARDRGAGALSSNRAAPGRALRIGLTGPIGCGKSTVGRWLAERGAVLVDADEAARAVTAPGTEGHEAILARFGDEVRAADGTLDRAALGRRVFADPALLRELEAIVHPRVRPEILDRMARAEKGGAPAVVVEAIRLVEGGLVALCDEVWLIVCEADDQRRRLTGRGMSPDDAAGRIGAQAGLADRVRPLATRVIDTSGSADATRDAVERALADALAAREAAL